MELAEKTGLKSNGTNNADLGRVVVLYGGRSGDRANERSP